MQLVVEGKKAGFPLDNQLRIFSFPIDPTCCTSAEHSSRVFLYEADQIGLAPVRSNQVVASWLLILILPVDLEDVPCS
jgi:hypothetical protein